MSFIASAVAVVAVGSTIYSSEKARTAANHQRDAIKAQAEADARAAAEAETSAAVAANAELAKRNGRRRNSALGMGDTSSTLGGGTGAPALGAPRYGSTAGRAAGSAIGATASVGAPAAASIGGGSALGMGMGGSTTRRELMR